MLVNALLVLTVAIVLFLFWVMLYDGTHFETTVYRIRDPKLKKKCKAVVLADLHNHKYGKENELLLQAIEKAEPDMVIVAGDILTAKPGAKLDVALGLLGKLAEKYPIHYGVGNHEHRIKLYPQAYGDMAQRYEKGLREMGLSLMENEKHVLEECGICITGSMIHPRFYKRFFHIPMEKDYLSEVLGRPDQRYYQILLAHNPDYFPEYASWGADLVLSGHIHGGVVRIPFWWKGLVAPSVRFFPKYDGGLFRDGKSTMILSRGLGCHTIPFRLFNPGDLIFLEMEPGEGTEMEKYVNIGKVGKI